MYRFFRPLLFRLDPERAHGLTIRLLRAADALPPIRALLRKVYAAPDCPVTAFGVQFRNPVGLAAGYDKDGLAWRGLAALGFGHIEVGTVTLRPQPGNPKPRVFRLVEDQGVINRMGFPGKGAEFVLRQLQGPHPKGLVLGINIGKNKDTPNEEALDDYLSLLRMFFPVADYLAVNVSSPNTVGLRGLQQRGALEELLGGLVTERNCLAEGQSRRVPLLVKLAPDLDDSQLDDALAAIQSTHLDGVILTNTTLQRDGLHSARRAETGGLSGAPLTALSLGIVKQVVKRAGPGLPVIGVGGIMSPVDAHRMLEAGASLVQVYTGLVYYGPSLPRDIVIKAHTPVTTLG